MSGLWVLLVGKGYQVVGDTEGQNSFTHTNKQAGNKQRTIQFIKRKPEDLSSRPRNHI